MKPGVRTPRDAIDWLKGARGALQRGAFLSARGRHAPRPAPAGTIDAWPQFTPWTRLIREVRTIVRSHHWLSIRGLAEPISILHVSDAHLRWHGRQLDALCDAVADSEADVVVLTGDIVTGGWRRTVADRLLNALPTTRWGSYSVSGNWEEIYDVPMEPWRDHLQSHGVVILDNAHVPVGPITLAGVADLYSGTCRPKDALAGAPIDRPAVVLAHSPATFDHLCSDPVRLVLSGHSHGGQIRLPLLGAPWLPRGTGQYTAGWFTRHPSHLFVSRGLGWSLLPVRWACPPELATIHLFDSEVHAAPARPL